MKNKFGMPGVMLATLLMSALMTSSCKKDDDDGGNNNGKTDPNTIATSNLIAFFPLETEGEDVEYSGNMLTFNQAVGATSFVTARRGNGYQGSDSEAYLEYDIASGSQLKTLEEVTVSCWIKTHHPLGGAAKILTINGGDPFMGAMALLQESAPAGDSVDIKFYIYDSESPDWKGQDIRIQSARFTNDLWFHLVALYNKTTSSMELYSNGVLVATQIKYAGPDPGEGDQPLLGPIKLGQDMTKLHIGTWVQQIAGAPEAFMKYYPGTVDEIRIFNKALSADEINDLYEAEVTQIN